MKYAEIPWSVEDTIENLEQIKEVIQNDVIRTNLHGRGEKDAEEVAFDFDRAIEALKKTIPMNVTDTHLDEYYCPACGSENCCDDGIVEDKFCPQCGQKMVQEVKHER